MSVFKHCIRAALAMDYAARFINSGGPLKQQPFRGKSDSGAALRNREISEFWEILPPANPFNSR